ncbi:hypothetical protein ALP64_201545 [Pseudomonas syringae pv. actinidiae]|nr:hypothetical protein ALP64_201545 [Pseudomonas syringae pv. actinidiae]
MAWNAHRPAGYREQVSVGNAKVITQQVITTIRQQAIQVGLFGNDRALGVGGIGSFCQIKKRCPGLVIFSGQVIEDLLQPCTRKRAVGWHQRRHEVVAQVLQHGSAFGQNSTVIQPQRRNSPFGVDRVIIFAGFKRVLAQVHLDQFVSDTRFVQHDVSAKRAGTRRVIELHKDDSSGG